MEKTVQIDFNRIYIECIFIPIISAKDISKASRDYDILTFKTLNRMYGIVY